MPHIEYLLTTEKKMFTEANSYCKSRLQGGTLALPRDQLENDCLKSFYPNTSFLTGGSQPWQFMSQDTKGQDINPTASMEGSEHLYDTEHFICQRGKAFLVSMVSAFAACATSLKCTTRICIILSLV